MLLLFLTAVLTAVSPWLLGALDLWVQTLVACCLLSASAAWLAFRIIVGVVPLPNLRHTLFFAALAAWVCLSAGLSPVKGAALPGLLPWGVTFWILLALPLVPEERRVLLENAWLATGWGLFLLAAYQHWFEGSLRPQASLLNPNVFATCLLILLPLSWERGRRLLFGALALALWWTDSLTAWLAVSALLLSLNFRRGGLLFGATLLLATLCLVSLHEKLASPSFLDRLFWWKSAGAMSAARPLMGFGPSSFSWVFPAYRPWLGALSSQFAHNYALETAAELGLPFALCWLAWIMKRWTEMGGWPRQAVFLVMLQSLGEYGLAIPSNAWMLASVLVLRYPMEPIWLAVPGRLKLPCLFALLGLAGIGAKAVTYPWLGQLAWVQAQRARDPEEARTLLRKARERFTQDGEPDTMLARLELHHYGADRRPGQLWKAAALQEEAAGKNPYRARAWVELETSYRLLGRPDLAQMAAEKARALGARR